MKKLTACLLLAATLPLQAFALSPDNAATGAAAVAVLAAKCNPDQAAEFKRRAFADLNTMLAEISAQERENYLDAAEMKVKALTLSSQSDTCAQAERLRSMARHWGFARYLND